MSVNQLAYATELLKLIFSPRNDTLSRAEYQYFYRLACVSKSWRAAVGELTNCATLTREFAGTAAELKLLVQQFTYVRDHCAQRTSVAAVVNGMKHLVVCKYEELQLSSVVALNKLCRIDYRETIMLHGGTDAAISAMLLHPTSLELNRECCRLLTDSIG